MKTKAGKLKLYILLAFLITSAHVLATDRVTYTISGKIKGLPDRTRIYLLKSSGEYKLDTISTTLSEGDAFRVRGTDDCEGKIHVLAFDKNDIEKVVPKGLEPMSFIIENRKISISGNIDIWPKVSFTDSKTNENYYKLIEEIRAINKDMRVRFPRGGGGMDSIYAYTLKQAFLKYPNSCGTSAILERYTLTLSSDDIRTIYNSFSSRVKNSYYGKSISKTLHYLTDPHSISEGKILPEFKLATASGDSISIAQYAASKEYVLIDIWASWCAPCKDEIPNLKEVYKKYSEKGLGIVSISIDKSKAPWEAALKKEALPWIQTWDPQELVAGNVFRVSSIPVYILIDKRGKLISFQAANGGIQSFGPELRDVKLHDTFSKLFGF